MCSESKEELKKNHLTDKVRSSTSLIVLSLVVQLKVKRFPIGQSVVRTFPRDRTPADKSEEHLSIELLVE